MPIYKTKPAYYTYAALSVATAMAGAGDHASQFWEGVRTPLKTMGFLTVKQAKRGELMPPNVGDFFMNASGPIVWPQGLGQSQQKESPLLVSSPRGGFVSFIPSKGEIQANFLPEQGVGRPFFISSTGRDPQKTVSSGEEEITPPVVFLSSFLEGQALNTDNLKKEILPSRRSLSLPFDPENHQFLSVNALNTPKVSPGKQESGAAPKLAATANLSKIQKGLTTAMVSPHSLKGKGVPSSVKPFIEPMPENLKHPLIDLETPRPQDPDTLPMEAMEEEGVEETLTLNPGHLPKRTVATFLSPGIPKTPVAVSSKKSSPKAFLPTSTSMQVLPQETVTFFPEVTLQESLPSLTVLWEEAIEETAPIITLLHPADMQRKTTLENQGIYPLEMVPVLLVEGAMPYHREPSRLKKSVYTCPLPIVLAFQRRPLSFREVSHLEIKFSWESLKKMFPSHTIQAIPEDPLLPSLLEASAGVTQSLKTLFQLSLPSTEEEHIPSSLRDSTWTVRGTLPSMEEALLGVENEEDGNDQASVVYTQFVPQNGQDLRILSTYANLSENTGGAALGKGPGNSNLQWLLERLKKLLKKRKQEVKALKIVLHTLEKKEGGGEEGRDDLVPPLEKHIHPLKAPQSKRGGELLAQGSLSAASFGFPPASLGDIKEDVFSGEILIPHQEKIDPNED